MAGYLLGIDQGTSGSRALVLDADGAVRGYGYRPLARLHPATDRVEQDPLAVAAGVREAIAEALERAGIGPADLAACGIASQRDTDFVWDGRTGRPLANAITWQDLRTIPLEAALRDWPLVGECRRRLGYWPGPWSGALHLAWRMQHDPVVRDAARSGSLRVGPSASWVLAALGGSPEPRADVSLAQSINQSRVVRLPDGGIPPIGSVAFGRTQECDYVCERIAESGDYWVARVVRPR
jgi:glycerol kinase